MFPDRLKLTMTVMSSGRALLGGGGFQQVRKCRKMSSMVLTGASSADPPEMPASSTAAASRSLLPQRAMAPSRLLDVGGDLDLHHLVGIGDRTAGGAGRRLLQLVDDVHALHHFTDHGVL